MAELYGDSKKGTVGSIALENNNRKGCLVMKMENGSVLAGVKVLDMGRVLAAPYCASILADMGADVIKVESPGVGDDARYNMPKKDGVSTYYVNFNRSKKGITLNLKAPEGKEILTKLIKEADVIIENFRPGVMAKLGFGYEDCKEINPGIIFASISGFGQDGPYTKRAGFDPIAQAMSGIMSITGKQADKRVRCGASIADVMAAQNAALAIVAALRYRDQTGRGQMIDVALTDVCIIGLSSVNLMYLTEGKIPEPLGNGYSASAPGDSFPTKEGEDTVVFLAGNQTQWSTLCDVLEHPEWKEVPEFIDNVTRVKNKPKLHAAIGEVTKTMTTDEVVEKLLSVGLPVGPIMNIEQVSKDPHFQGAREMFTEVEHPKVGTLRITNQSFKMSETSPYVRGCSPELGEHNMEVLTGLGYSEEEIEGFAKSGVI